MTFYIILYLSFLLFCILQLVYKLRFSKISLLFMGALIFFSGVRVDTGIDYRAYLDIWNYMDPIDKIESFILIAVEPGFVFLTSLIKYFTDKPVYFYLITSLLAILPIYPTLLKLNIKDKIISFFIYFLVFYITYPFNGIRQGIAMGIFIFSLPLILNKKFFEILLLTIVATLIHTTGILIIVSYFAVCFNIKVKYFFIIGLIFSLICWKLDILNYILFNYLGVSEVYTELFTESTSVFQIITRTLLIGLLFYFGIKLNSPIYNKLLMLYMLGFFIYIALFDHNLLATRFNMFFRLLEVIMVPMLLEKTKNIPTRLVLFLIFLIPFTYSFSQSLQIKENEYHLEFNF